MEKPNNILIGVTGKKRSGKDLFATMINYILYSKLYKQGDKCDYNSYKDYEINKNTIIHFADGLKEILSCLFNIPLKYFNDDFKDYRIFRIKEYLNGKVDIEDAFMLFDFIHDNEKYKILNNSDLSLNNLNYYLSHEDKFCCITIRTLLQYFGTNIGRNIIYNNIWVSKCINNAKNILKYNKYCIISDVRFINEEEAIKKEKGIIIKINRKSINNKVDYHESENYDIKGDYSIYNNNTEESLFYGGIEIVNKILSKYETN